MESRIKYIIAGIAATIFMVCAYYFPAETFLTFTVGWLFFIPAAFIVYMVHGLIVYMNERKHSIIVKPVETSAMRALARREAELKREKERLLYEEFNR